MGGGQHTRRIRWAAESWGRLMMTGSWGRRMMTENVVVDFPGRGGGGGVRGAEFWHPPKRPGRQLSQLFPSFTQRHFNPCRTSCPKSSTCFFFSDISIFLGRKCLYTPFFFSNLYAIHGAMRHGFVSHGRCRPLS